MKKLLLVGVSMCFVLTLFSCKSSESAYRRAYDKAKKQATKTTEEAVEVVDVFEIEKPAPKKEVTVRKEKVNVVSGNVSLKEYGVVVGSFGVKANAEGLKEMLEREGYNPTIAFNADIAMYRVIVSSHANKNDAAAARDDFKAKYPSRKDFQQAWILHRVF